MGGAGGKGRTEVDADEIDVAANLCALELDDPLVLLRSVLLRRAGLVVIVDHHVWDVEMLLVELGEDALGRGEVEHLQMAPTARHKVPITPHHTFSTAMDHGRIMGGGEGQHTETPNTTAAFGSLCWRGCSLQ